MFFRVGEKVVVRWYDSETKQRNEKIGWVRQSRRKGYPYYMISLETLMSEPVKVAATCVSKYFENNA